MGTVLAIADTSLAVRSSNSCDTIIALATANNKCTENKKRAKKAMRTYTEAFTHYEYRFVVVNTTFLTEK